MNTYIEIAITVILVIVGFGGGAFLNKTKQGKTIQGLIDSAIKELPDFEKIASLVEEMLPVQFQPAAELITEVICKGISLAEQMSNSGELPADQRKAEALQDIEAALKIEGIKLDEKTAAIISDVVDVAARVLLPHKRGTVTAESVTQTVTQATVANSTVTATAQ